MMSGIFSPNLPSFKQCWDSLKWFRVAFSIALVWAILRLAMQIALIVDPTSSSISIDLQVYLDAAQNFMLKADLYPESLEVLEYHFPYPPVFALLFVPFLYLPKQITVIIQLIFHILAFYALFIQWAKIFQEWSLENASKYLMLSAPVWLIFSAFWDDLLYLNIYTIMALLGTLLLRSILKDNLPQAVLWLTLILISKPHWAFAAIIPLFLKRYPFFFKLILFSLASYLSLALATWVIGGPAYITSQYVDYVGLLGRLGQDFPWRESASGFMGYNHSIKQIFAYLFGSSPTTLLAATLAKIILLVPLAWITIKRILYPAQESQQRMTTVLEMFMLLYLGVFIWLDIVWEAFLVIAIFGYLLSIQNNLINKIAITITMILYAILDMWRLFLYVVGAPMESDYYLLWDYSIYVPIVMLVILTFYSFLLSKQWTTHNQTGIS